MRKTPTIQQAERIATIMKAVTFVKGQEVSWHGHIAEARELCKDLSGYKPSKSNCIDCETKVLNILAESIGLPPFEHPASADRQAFRMDVCRMCPAFHATTESCGRLIVDALFPEPVMIDGEEVKPCGCYLPIKTSMKRATCPAGRWT